MSDNKNAEQSKVKEDGKEVSQSSIHQEGQLENKSNQPETKTNVKEATAANVIHPQEQRLIKIKKDDVKIETKANEVNEDVNEDFKEEALSDIQADASIRKKSSSNMLASNEKKAYESQKQDNSLHDDQAIAQTIEKKPSSVTEENKNVDEAELSDYYKAAETAAEKGSKNKAVSDISDKNTQSDENTKQEVAEKLCDSQPLTIEEKRKQQRENKLTIEEKRRLQKNQMLIPPESNMVKKLFKKFVQHTDLWDRVFLAVLLLCESMTFYISSQIMRYTRFIYALGIFLVLTIAVLAIFWVMTKKKCIGYLGSGILALLLAIGSFGAYRLAAFSSQVFNNIETETVMIVTAKDSKLTPSSDFAEKKIAVIEFDVEINGFAREILLEEKKIGYQEVAYSSYKEAYADMQAGRIDMMVYDIQIQKNLEEEGIDSKSYIKVLFKKTFRREAVKSKAVDITKDPFNVYISGVDLSSHGINEKGNSDVNIILTVNPQTKKMIMQTIPRDSWTPIACMNDRHSKLTYAGVYGGIDCSIQTIEKTYGITINYYAKINFQGVIDLVDAMGGVTVISDVGFCESHPFEDFGVRDYCFTAGANEVDGINALMFSRIRRVFSEGDIERGRHQMALVEAVMNKFVQEPTMDHINGLLVTVQNNFTTNLAESDVGKALQLFIKLQDHIQNIEMYTMKGEMIWDDDEIRNEHLYYFYPNDGEIAAFQQRIRDVIEGK